MENTHSPFEPGYVGNSDAGAVAVDDAADFPGHRLTELGFTETELERVRAGFDELDRTAQTTFVEDLMSLSDDDVADALNRLRKEWAAWDAYAALSDDEKAALTALSDEEREALTGLTDAEREALATPQGPTNGIPEDVREGTIQEVLDWVNGDRGRAETALAVEESRDKPRAGVVGPLTQLLNETTG